MRRASGVIALSALGMAAGVYSLRLARETPAFSFAGAAAGGDAALLAAGLALIACGAASWARRPASGFGPLLAAAGFAWFLLEWNNPGIGSALAFTVGLSLYAACPPLVAHAVLAPVGMTRMWIQRSALALAYCGGVLVLGVGPALFSSPRAEGCNQCPRNLVLIAERGALADALRRAGVYLGLAWALILVALILARLARSTPAMRRIWWPLLAIGSAYTALVAATFAASLDRGFIWNGTLQRHLWLGEAAALIGIAGAVVWSWLVGRRTRTAVARLVVELAQASPPGGLRGTLAGIMGDPDLVIAYPLGDSGRLVDAEGRPVDLSTRSAQTDLLSAGRRVAVIGHAPGLLDDAQLVEEVSAAARLALENERLQAEVRARLDELRASRARIVATGDGERKRLERNLHDGAQQRLVALSLSLRLLRSQLIANGRAGDSLREAETELECATSELRELAHGIFPAVLADAGLAVAVRALAEEGPVPIRAIALPEGRFRPEVETAAYAVVAEAARAATAGLLVRGTEHNGVLVVEIEAAGARASLDRLSLEDRVGALDGQLAIERSGTRGVRIRAEFPCGS
jgi:signal transduction histidine kinase